MTIVRHALAADAEHIASHAAVMTVAVPSAMDRHDCPVVDAPNARQGRLRWSRLAARRGREYEARCDCDGAEPGQQVLHRCPPFQVILTDEPRGSLAATRLPTSGVTRSAEVAHAPHKMAVRIWQGDGGAAADAGNAREEAADVTPRGKGRGGHRTL